MLRNLRSIFLCLVIALALGGSVFTSAALSQETAPILLQTSDVLSRELISGSNYSVKPTVISDGFICTYDLNTLYGPLRVESKALLMKRIGELNALTQIEQIKGSSAYMNAFKQVAAGPIKTAEGLATDPAGTVTNVVSGIGQLFSNVSSAVTSDSSYKGNVMDSALGQANYKRQYAAQFGVDPYSSYEPLQKALNDLSWAAAAGGLTVKAAFMAIPGGAGIAVGATGSADTLSGLLGEKTPAEVASMNQATLAGLGVSNASIQSFLYNSHFDPYEQTLLVKALAGMPAVANCGIYIDKAAGAFEESVAVFLRTRAQLLNQYAAKTGNVQRFVDANGIPVFQTVNGKIIAIFPLDYIAWTPNFARKADAVSAAIKQMPGVTGKEFWVTGKVSPVARKAMEAKGWKVEERADLKLSAR